jgi:hypothetical protein
MKLSVSPLSLVAMTTVFTLATANFDIYYAEYNPEPADSRNLQMGFVLFNDDPADCTAVENSPFIPLKEDLGKDLMAVKCHSVTQDGTEVGCALNDASLPSPHASKQAS